jgi:hypothetical protein
MAEKNNPKQSRGVRRIPQQSLLYERIVPIALIGMGVLLVGIVLVALGFLLGVIRF